VTSLAKRSLIAAAALVVLSGALRSDDAASPSDTHVRYRVTHLPPLGGSSSLGSSINNRGWVAGRSHLDEGNQIRRATLWRSGQAMDLGTLGGPDRNSNVVWPVKNVIGLIAGISQTDEPDPLEEAWSCSAFFPPATGTGYRCLGFVWQKGVMRPLPTLGGTHGFATGANNWGQVVGWAENKVRDRSCVLPQKLQFRAVVWGPGPHQIRELPPLPRTEDSVSAATAINDWGQVVGISGKCDDAVGKFSANHDVMWERGVPRDLGDIGGGAWNTPMAINAQGDVAGFGNVSDTPNGEFNAHAFLWTREGGMRDLDTLGDDVFSQAYGINARRQVVGRSCDQDFNCRAFLWQDGVMTELKQLVPGYRGTLTIAADIDDLGRISGQAVDATGARVAFLATPSDAEEVDAESGAPTQR
jgi:probable HAF family extracellular repeat protein